MESLLERPITQCTGRIEYTHVTFEVLTYRTMWWCPTPIFQALQRHATYQTDHLIHSQSQEEEKYVPHTQQDGRMTSQCPIL